MSPNEVLEALGRKRLVFTITSGRSGTGLLTALLRDSLGIVADHEPAPRVNFVLRSLVADPDLAPAWLLIEKLPAMRERASGPVYAETSHLFCKGLIEPMLDVGLRPAFVILSRDAGQVARSLYQMNVVPERTGSGRTVLLGPSDPGVLQLPGWRGLSDYQLCFWYAREIERRQSHYRGVLGKLGLPSYDVAMSDLLDWDAFVRLSAFVAADHPLAPDRARYEAVIGRNQNSRAQATGRGGDRALPPDLLAEEREVDDILRAVASGGI